MAIFGSAPTAAQEPPDAPQPLEVQATEPAPGADKRDENSKPTFAIEPANREVPENSPAGTNVGRAVTATDPDRDTLAYSLSGTGSDKFAVDANGQITVTFDNSLDYETTRSYALTLGVKDEKDDNGDAAPMEADDATVSVNISLSDVSPPAAPYDLGFSPGPTDRDTSRIIRWRTRVTAGVPPATGFEAQYRPVGIDDWTTFSFESDDSTTEATITGLASNTFYEAQVRAINIEGPSPWSESTYATTSTTQLIVAFGNAAYSVIEGQTVNITVTVTPPADRNVTLTVTMTGDGAAFVDASGNELRLAITRGVESTTFGVITDADSGGEEVDLALAPPTGRLSLGDPSTATVTINRTPTVNSAPFFTEGSNTERTVPENSPGGVRVGGALAATDADADPLTYTLSGHDAALFDIHSATGQLTVASGTNLDYEAGVSYSVTVQASDGKATAEITVAIRVTNVGESPVLDDGVSTTIEIAENSSTGANVGQAITATDPEGSSVTYSLAGEDASLFRIHSTTGQISVAPGVSLDFETKASYAATVQASDGETTAAIAVTINVTDVPLPPAPEEPGLSAGSTNLTSQRTLKWTAPDTTGIPPVTGYDVRYRPWGTGDEWADHSFDSDSNTTETTIIGMASNTEYEAQVRAVNLEGPGLWSESARATTHKAQLTVAFGSPTYTVTEGQTVYIEVTVNPAADREVTVTITMTGEGATFADGIGDELELAISRGESSGEITIKADEDDDLNDAEVTLTLSTNAVKVSLGEPSVATVTISDNTPNTLPSFVDGSNTQRSVPENSVAGTNVGGPLTAIDSDGHALIYTLSGDDAALFDLHPAIGQLTVASGTSLDYEAGVGYSVTVQASDGKATAEIAVAIRITNVGESPVLDDGVSTTIEIAENSSTGANVGQAITATDPEGSSVTYSLAGEDASLFRIHSTTGQISVAPGVSLDFETKASYATTVQASDGETTAAIAVTINVTDVPPPPSPKEPGLSAGSTNLTSQRTLKWTAPDAMGIPPVTGYDVRYRPWGTGDEWADHSFDSDGNTTETTITGLESNTEYEAQVRAVNLEGPGPWSASARATTHKAQLTVALGSSAYTVTEGQTVDIEITVNPAADREVTVTITLTGEGGTFADSIGDEITLTISRGESSGEITIQGDEDDDLNDAEVTLTLSTNAVKVSLGEPSITIVTISDNTPNTLPSFVDGSNTRRSVPENSVAGTNVGVPLTAIDPDGHTLIYTLSGDDAALFEISSATGQLTVASGASLNHEAGVSYSVTVQASDGTATAEIAVTIDVTDVNEPPRFGNGVPTTIEVTENSPAGTSIGQAFAVIDPEGDTLTYSLSGAGTDKFAVDGGGQITVTGALDYESTSSYALILGVKDKKGDDGAVAPSEIDDATIEVTIGVTNVNEPPAFDDGAPTNIEIAENSSTGTNVGPTFTANDPEGDTLAYSLSGTESDKFAVGGRGQITVADDSLDYESTQSYVIVLGIKDNKDDNGVATPNEADDTTFPLTIKVIDVNEPPVFHDGFPTTVEIAENSPVGTSVGQQITAIDPEGDALTYSLSGIGSDKFAVNDRGQITVAGSLDYETTVSYVPTLGVKDKRDDNGDADPIEANDATIALTISITDLPPPLAPYDLGFSAAAGSTDFTSELTIKWTAPDTTGIPQMTRYEVRYRPSRIDGEWTGHNFDSDGRTTQTTIAGLASNTQYEAQVRAVDIEGPSPWSESVYATTHKAQLTVAFGNEAYEVTEGRIVNVAVTVDPPADRAVDVTVTMTGEGAMLADATGSELELIIPRSDASAVFGVAANAHSGGREITLALTTTAVIVSVGDPSTTTVTINHDLTTNDSPSFTEGSNTERTVPENSPAGTHIGPTVKATDTDGDPLTYSIFGSDAALFDIHPSTGQITVAGGAILDYETVVSHSVTVLVSDRDRKAVAEIAVTITVTNVNEAPTFDDAVPTQVEIAENSPAGTPVGKAFTATDPEGDSFTYAISGPDETLFAIDSSSGQIEVASGTRLDYEDSPNSYSVTVQASDGEAAADLAITINVTDVNEAPTFDDISTKIEVAENSPSGTNVGHAFIATDPEDATLIYSLSASDAAFFRINPATGQMTVARGASLDFEAGVSYSVTVHVSDGDAASDITVTINVTDVNEAPVFDDGATTIIEIAENSSTGTNVGQPFTAIDPEGDTFTYLLIGSDAAFFDIHPTTGQIIVASEARLDYESGVRYSLMVQATDGEAASEIAVSVRVTDVNEPPVFGNDIPTIIEIAENSDGWHVRRCDADGHRPGRRRVDLLALRRRRGVLQDRSCHRPDKRRLRRRLVGPRLV